MRVTRLVLAVALTAACRGKSAEPSADAASAPSTTTTTAPAALMSVPDSAPPASSVWKLGDDPDVRVTLSPASDTKGVAKAGQTFGILIPHPDDFLDDWELDGPTSLGEPLTFISRGGLGMELVWKVADDKLGTHAVKLRMMHRTTRTSPRKPAKRVVVTVTVAAQ